MRMPEGDGLFVVTELSRRGRLPATLILTTFDDDEAAIESSGRRARLSAEGRDAVAPGRGHPRARGG